MRLTHHTFPTQSCEANILYLLFSSITCFNMWHFYSARQSRV